MSRTPSSLKWTGLIACVLTICNLQCYATLAPLDTQQRDHLVNPRQESPKACRLAAPPNVDLSIGFGKTISKEGEGSSWFVPSTGNVNSALMFIDFPDAPAKETTASLLAGLLPNAVTWYKTSSYGRLNLSIQADTSKFYRMLGASTSYNWNRATFSVTTHKKYVQDAINSFDSQSFVEKVFGKPDLLYLLPTRSASRIPMSPTYMSAMKFKDGTQVRQTVTFGQDLWNSWGYKVMNHETGHTFGLPDLYPDRPNLPTEYYVGGWDLMGLISGTGPDYFGWHKWKLGWIDSEQVDCISTKGSSTHTITPLESVGGVKMAVVRLNDTAALVAEVRAPLGNDKDICSKGLLLYTINTKVSSGGGPIRVVDTRVNKKTCTRAGRGGTMTGAAWDFTKGETKIDVPAYGVSITIDAMEEKDSAYKLTVNWK